MKGILKLTILFVIGICPFTANAQSKSKPKPMATPLPTFSGAEIISRAEDYDESRPSGQPAENQNEKSNAAYASRIKELTERIKKLEAEQSNSYDEKQKRLLLNIDILTRAEQRAESLRKQLFDMIEKENAIKMRLDQIEVDMRPEAIERSVQMAGSLRPEDVRDSRRKTLLAEKNNLTSLLLQIQQHRTNLEAGLSRADLMVEKLRARLEKDIEDSFLKNEEQDK